MSAARFDARAHHDLVSAFFEEQKVVNPERYREISERFPILNAVKFRRIRRSERPLAALPSDVAASYGFEPTHDVDYEV